jgi:Tol biopolymer transport system component
MNKKLIVILIIILLVILTGGLFIASRNNGDTGESGGLFSLFPFGRGGDDTDTGTGTTGINTGTNGNVSAGTVVSGLRKITSEPISGAGFVNLSTTTVAIRFVDKATGHIYEFSLQNPSPKRISNTTIPQIEEVYWSKKSNELVGRFIKDGIVNTLYMKLVSTTTTTFDSEDQLGIESTFLPSNIEAFTLSPDSKKIFYILPDNSGASGYLADADGTGADRIWTSPLKHWLISWPSDPQIILQTPPSSGSEGFLFSLNPKNGNMEKIIGNKTALSAKFAPNGNLFTYSEKTDDGIILSLHGIKEGFDIGAGTRTFADKCTWSNDSAAYYCASPKNNVPNDAPDSWYQGRVQFNDRVLQISVADGSVNVIADPETLFGEQVDAVDLQVSPDNSHLIFTNKIDGSLWMLTIPELVQRTAD